MVATLKELEKKWKVLESKDGNTYNQFVEFEGRLSYKTEVLISKDKRSRYMWMYFEDDTGILKAILFDDFIKKYRTLSVGKTFALKTVYCRPVCGVFKNYDKRATINVTVHFSAFYNSLIEEKADVPIIKHKPCIMSLAEVQESYDNSSVSFRGFCIDVSEVDIIGNGDFRRSRMHLILADEQTDEDTDEKNIFVEVELFDEDVQKMQNPPPLNKVIVVEYGNALDMPQGKRVRIEKFSSIDVEEGTPHSQRLEKWARENTTPGDLKKQYENTSYTLPMVDSIEELIKRTQRNGSIVKVRSTIRGILAQKVTFVGCPYSDCTGRTKKLQKKMYQCNRCTTKFEKKDKIIKYELIMYISSGLKKSKLQVRVDNNPATVLLKRVAKSAEEFRKNIKDEKARQVMSEQNGREIIFHIKETKGGEGPNYYVVGIEDDDDSDESSDDSDARD